MSTEGPNPEQLTEEQLRAAYEAEMKSIRVEHVLLESVVTLINLGMRRAGLLPGTENEADPSQLALAVDSVRALMPVVEKATPEQAQPIKAALSQLQLAFVQASAGISVAEAASQGGGAGQAGGGAGQPSPGSATGGSESMRPGEPGPAQRSGRLWVPGQ